MNFELGKTYIVDVNEKGIIPLMEFDRSKWYDKDHDDLYFLTDEEKIVVVNSVLDKIRVEIDRALSWETLSDNRQQISDVGIGLELALSIIDKYNAESEE